VVQNDLRKTIVSYHIQLLFSGEDNSLKLKKKVKNDLKYKGKVRKLEDILQIKNEMYAITSFHNRKKEINYLFAQ